MKRQLCLLWLVVTIVLLGWNSTARTAHAQGIQVEWERWDVAITVGDDDSLTIQEMQQVKITQGTVRRGNRYWTTPVNVLAVFAISGEDKTPIILHNDNSGVVGTYSVSDGGSNTTLQYVLPHLQSKGDVFSVFINYITTSLTAGIVDWIVVPADHDFIVQNSAARVTFPKGIKPDMESICVTQGHGEFSIDGNTVIIRATQAIEPQQKWAIQIPYAETNSDTFDAVIAPFTAIVWSTILVLRGMHILP